MNAQALTPEPSAQEAFEEGVLRAKEGDFEAALKAFERAHAVAPHHVTLFNIARAQEALNLRDAALATYAKYLDAGRGLIDAERREFVAARMVELRAATEAEQAASTSNTPRAVETTLVLINCSFPEFQIRQGIDLLGVGPLSGTFSVVKGLPIRVERSGYVVERIELPESDRGGSVKCTPRFAKVRNGSEWGKIAVSGLPAGANVRANGVSIASAADLPVGKQLLELSAPGHHPKKVQVSIGSYATVHVRESLKAIEPERRTMSTRGVVGVSLASLGAAALGTGLVVFLWNDARHANWQDTYDEINALPPEAPGRGLMERESNQQLSQIEQADAVTWGLVISGAALATAGTLLWLWPQDEIGVAIGAKGAMLRGTF